MFKKLLLTSAVVLAMQSPALAQDYNDNYDSPLTGAYLGVSGGYSWTDADDADVNGDEYGVFVGYKLDQWLQSNFGMTGAIEAHYEWSGADDDGIEKDDSWGVQFRPGVAFLDAVNPFAFNPYAILGYKRAEFETAAGSEDHDGFELGIGTEVVSYGDVGVRVDYSHTWYSDEGGVDPNEHALKAGLSYHF